MQKGQILIWIIVGALVVLVAGGAYYLGTKKSSVPIPSPTPVITSQTPQPISSAQKAQCNTKEFYTQLLQKGFGSNVALEVNNSSNSNEIYFDWKRKEIEPFTVYPAQVSLSVNLGATTSQDLNSIYKASVDEVIKQAGYQPDLLNTNFFEVPAANVQSYGYGYKKSNLLLKIYFDHSTSGNGSVHPLSLSCGTIDATYDALYTDLLSSPAGVTAVQVDRNNSFKNTIFSIWEIHQNNIIYTNISSHDWIGGHAAWFYKENNQWKEIYGGQQRPSCDLLEKYHIEAGVDCLGSNSAGPAYIKTK